jgi:glycosyltransferase 2 family protein
MVVIVIMILYVAFAFYIDIGKFSKVVLNINYWIIPLILVPESLSLLLLALRFHRLLQALDINISIKKSILIYFTGLSLTVTPANSGQVVKSQVIKRQLGYAISKTSPIIVFEKWSELTSVLIILVVFAIANTMVESTVIIIIGGFIALSLFAIMRNAAFFMLFKRVLLRFSRLKKFEESIENSRGTLKTLFSRRIVFEGFVLTTPAKILEAASVFLAFQALGIKISFIASTQIFFTALLSGIFSFIPGGLGVTEGSMLGLLIKYYGGNLALLGSAVIFARIITIWYATCLGIITSQFVMKKRSSQ